MRQMDIAPGLRISNDRCAFLTSSKTMVLADLHLGIEASLEMDGLQIPRSQGQEMKGRISEAVGVGPSATCDRSGGTSSTSSLTTWTRNGGR